MAKRLTEEHPLTQKLRKLEAAMAEIGIALEWDGYRMKAMCTQTGESANYRDAESGEALTEVPSFMESKLTRDE